MTSLIHGSSQSAMIAAFVAVTLAACASSGPRNETLERARATVSAVTLGSSLQVDSGPLQNELRLQRNRELEAAILILHAKHTGRGLVVTLDDGLFDVGQAVLIDTGQAVLRGSARRTLDNLTAFLHAYPQRSVQIEAHTDNAGADDDNQQLSDRRAGAVQNALTASGIATDRIHSRGLGARSPVADNDSAAGRQQNRRVEVIISEDDGRTAARDLTHSL